jgi:hypothetical protein
MEQRAQKTAATKIFRSNRRPRRLFNLYLIPFAPIETQGVSQPRDPFELAKPFRLSNSEVLALR